MRPWLPLLVLLLAGCGGTTPEPTPVLTDQVFPFDGQGAYEFVEGLVFDEGGERYRIPGTPGHASGADWLEAQMQMPGWTIERITFPGTWYRAADKSDSSIAAYADHPGFCLERDQKDMETTQFHNLVAKWPGPSELLLGAHWDSKEEANEDNETAERGLPVLGANDGASGVGVLLQLMRHVADGDLIPPVGLTIVFFDGEDGFQDCHPLAGSFHYATTQQLPDRMILLDMVGDAEARFVREPESVKADGQLVDLLWHHGGRVGLGNNLLDRQSVKVVDDHTPFLEKGVRAVDIVDFGRENPSSVLHDFPPYWHTRDDTMVNIDAGMLGRVGSMVATTMRDPAFVSSM